MQIIPVIFIGILGASLGSFIGVVNTRLAKGKKGIIFGRSACPLCRKKLKAKDLIPLLSFIILKGKCGYCSKKISVIYPALELINALAFIAIYLKFPFFGDGVNFGYSLYPPNLWAFLIFALYALFFTAIFFYDLLHNEVPELYLYSLIGVSLAGSLLLRQPDITSIGVALLISLGFFGGQYLLSRGRWLGDGDIFFAISMAIILGWQSLLVAIAAAYLLGGIISVILLLKKQAGAGTAVPFTPFLVLGTYVAIMFGEPVAEWVSLALMI